jgi:hypothetical protein
MASSLDTLVARSATLTTSLGDEEALATNAAILKLAPEDRVAITRLAIGLLNAGRAAESIAVLEAGLEAHPDNRIMLDRLAEAHRALAAATRQASKIKARPPAGARRRTGGPCAWIKPLRNGSVFSEGEEAWISDAGRVGADGERTVTASGVPWGQPSWKVGEHIGLVDPATQRVRVLVEVIEAPRFDPEFVAEQTGSATEGEQWPWVTAVRVITARPVLEAPALSEIGAEQTTLQQRSRKMLDAQQRETLLGLLGPAA